jgi:excisionase family DNA binding protein
MDSSGEYLDIDQAAALLRVKPSTLYAWVHQRRLPFRKHGRRLVFSRHDLERWSAANAVASESSSGRETAPQLGDTLQPGSLKTRRTVDSQPGS